MNMWYTRLLLLLLLLIGLSMMALQQQHRAEGGQQQVPCFFIFGDSLVDSGNNNNLPTLAKVNYLPYGVDFPDGPTGRFCNGRTSADIIGEFLGLDDFIPPFASAMGPQILKGVNYGSGSAGILDITAYNSGARISMDMQLVNHEITISRMKGVIGEGATESMLQKCIYLVSMGSNDYINNYFMPYAYPITSNFTPHHFASHLIALYTHQLQTLYKQGARKVAVYGVGLIGCVPAELLRFPSTSPCVDTINNAAAIFNQNLKSMLIKLNSKLHGAKFTYLGVFRSTFNRSELNKVGTSCEIEASTGLCRALSETEALIRNSNVYWDGFHPTEAANKIIAKFAYNAQIPDDAFPYDISQLAAMP